MMIKIFEKDLNTSINRFPEFLGNNHEIIKRNTTFGKTKDFL